MISKLHIVTYDSTVLTINNSKQRSYKSYQATQNRLRHDR